MSDFLDLDALLSGSYPEALDSTSLFEDFFAPHGTNPVEPENNPPPEQSKNQSESMTTKPQSSQLSNKALSDFTKKTRFSTDPISKPSLDLGLNLVFKERPNQYNSDRAIFIKGPHQTKNNLLTFYLKNPEAFRNGRLWFSLYTYSGVSVTACNLHQKPNQQEFAAMFCDEEKIENGHKLDGWNQSYSLAFICSNNCLNLTSEDRLRIRLQVVLSDKSYNFEKELFICKRPYKKYKAFSIIRKRPFNASDSFLEFEKELYNGVQPNQLNSQLGIRMNKILRAFLE